MTKVTNRRPLPALVFLLALTLLTSLVWWRVLNRSSADGTKSCGGPTLHALPRPSQISLVVLNSTDRKGLARTASASLGKVGFNISGYANDAGHRAIRGVAEIRYTPDQADAAKMVSYYVPGATMVRLTTADTTLVLSLGQRFRRLATATAVTQQMAQDKTTLLGKNGAPSASPTC